MYFVSRQIAVDVPALLIPCDNISGQSKERIIFILIQTLTNMNLQDIRNLISLGDTPGAIKALGNSMAEGAGRNQRLRNDLIILSNRYEDLTHKETLGEMPPNDAVRERSLVNHALLNLIDEMETGRPAREPVEAQPIPPKGETPSRMRPLWIVAGILLVAIGLFFFRSGNNNRGGGGDTNGPVIIDPPPVRPERVIDINGYWKTNKEHLVYLIEQNGSSYTWRVVGAPDSGTGRVEGENVISKVGGRDVVSFVSAKFPDGRPSELRTHDPQFADLVLYREN